MYGAHIVVIINSLFSYLLKKRIIDLGQIEKETLDVLLKPIGLSSEPLKWGLLLLFGGIGLVIIEFLLYEANQSSLPYGIEALSLIHI